MLRSRSGYPGINYVEAPMLSQSIQPIEQKCPKIERHRPDSFYFSHIFSVIADKQASRFNNFISWPSNFNEIRKQIFELIEM